MLIDHVAHLIVGFLLRNLSASKAFFNQSFQVLLSLLVLLDWAKQKLIVNNIISLPRLFIDDWYRLVRIGG